MQVVGYRPLDPSLRVASDDVVEALPLTPGTDLAFRLGERHCAGTVQNGRHAPCSNPGAPYCPTHTVPWSVASNADSEEEHAVYLAAFAPATFKVGVTRSWRLPTRLEEQGADRAAHVHTVSDGRVAREVEADIAREVGDQVRVATKLAGLHRAVDDGAWEALLADFRVIERFDFDYGFDLSGRPVAETMLTGRVVGTKGRLLVLEREGTVYAVDLRDLVGYDLREGPDDRARQASLTSF
ncbi:DUF2797 domain-containing protein [Halomarina litorea]|uniref:DUF2797 domain-containing protein n=1 Tax=Halomarina litorea TaxID=2961595 RepID=UPI0020C232B4|nr:DUF2797 domain-containing protein [Halomarina sp. BCD28]